MKNNMKDNIVLNGIRLDSGSNNKVIPLGNGWEFDLEKKVKRSVLC